jgi:hypothetical protein
MCTPQPVKRQFATCTLHTTCLRHTHQPLHTQARQGPQAAPCWDTHSSLELHNQHPQAAKADCHVCDVPSEAHRLQAHTPGPTNTHSPRTHKHTAPAHTNTQPQQAAADGCGCVLRTPLDTMLSHNQSPATTVQLKATRGCVHSAFDLQARGCTQWRRPWGLSTTGHERLPGNTHTPPLSASNPRSMTLPQIHAGTVVVTVLCRASSLKDETNRRRAATRNKARGENMQADASAPDARIRERPAPPTLAQREGRPATPQHMMQQCL